MNYYCLECNKKLTNKETKKKICPCGQNDSIQKDIISQKKLSKITEEIFKRKNKNTKFEYGRTIIPLSIPTYSTEETMESFQSLLSTYVTYGQKVKDFENIWSKYSDIKFSTLVTSGSTANSLALATLTDPNLKKRILPGDEIITPALTFATTVYPILDVNAVPVLVDIDLKTLNIDENLIEKAITPKTKAIMPVHLLGNPCKIDVIKKIAKKHNLYLIEDAADSSGAEYHGKKLGSWGDFSTFSFFFTHIMSTIEGGMISTNDPKLAELAKSKRSFGWIRDLKDKKKYERKYKNIDPRFLFISRGFNYKPTEIQGAFGIHQIKKLDAFVEARRKNANYWAKELEKFKEYFITIKEQPNTKSAWYGFPIIVQNNAPFKKQDLIRYLNSKGVQTRPILAGNIAQQPVAKTFKYRQTKLKNAEFVNNNSFWIGNHHGIGKIEREAVASYFEDFIAQYE